MRYVMSNLLSKRKVNVIVAIALALFFISFFTFDFIREQQAREALEEWPVKRYGPYVTEYELPTSYSAPMALTLDREGHLWIGAANLSSLIHFDPRSVNYESYALPLKDGSWSIWDLEVDRRGDVWFVVSEDDSVWRLDPESGELMRYVLPTKRSFPIQLAIDGYGAVWVTQLFGGKVSRIDPDNDSVKELNVPGKSPAPLGIEVGPRGYLWVTERNEGKVLRIDPSTGEIAEVKLSTRLYTPVGIAVDEKGYLWVVEYADERGSVFTRIDPRSGELIRYATSLVDGSPSLPLWVKVDSRGKVWINQQAGNKIAVFDPEREVLVEYKLPPGKYGGSSNAIQFALGNGKVWFSEWTENKVGVIDEVSELPFSLEVSPRRVVTASGKQIGLTLKVNGEYRQPLYLSFSGTFSPTGIIELGGKQELKPPNGGEYTIDLTLEIDKAIKAGNYTLTISLSNEYLVYSVIVRVQVLEVLTS